MFKIRLNSYEVIYFNGLGPNCFSQEKHLLGWPNEPYWGPYLLTISLSQEKHLVLPPRYLYGIAISLSQEKHFVGVPK